MSLKRRTADPPEHQQLMLRDRDDEVAELRHRLTNNLQLVLALIARESARSTDPEVKAALQRLSASVQQLTMPLDTAEEVEVGR